MASRFRIKWKLVMILVAFLALGVVSSCLFIGKMRERKPFVSKVVAGYRFRCTLSMDWQPKQNTSPASASDSYMFSASPSPIREWIADHLFHQSPAKGMPVKQKRLLVLGIEPEGWGDIHMQSGYPELNLGAPGSGRAKALPGKHFRIDSCPATLTGLDLTTIGLKNQYLVMLVCTPDYKSTYYVSSVAEPQDSDSAEREMQAVISSFHVEKVADASSGKQ